MLEGLLARLIVSGRIVIARRRLGAMGQARRVPVAREFGRRVRQRRQELGWSLERLAEQAGLHWTYVGSVERGERNLSLVNIVRLAAALDVDAGELLRGLRP